MSAFVAAALLLAVLAALFLAWPLLRRRQGQPAAPLVALLAIVVVIGAGAVVYALLGNRGWARPQAATPGSASIAALARHLEGDPADLPGWLELGSAYSGIGQYALALRAFERANRLANGGNASALAGVGQAMLLGGDSVQAAQAPEFFERALQLDPKSPQALFYGALIAYHSGQLSLARDRFMAMLSLSPPENVRVALQKQIDEINTALQPPKVDAATAIRLHVTLAAALSAKVPAQASLFVFVAAADGGPPLAVKRSAVSLPQDVELSAADAMIAGRAVRPGQKVSVVARISASGNPVAQSGDLYGQIDYLAGKSGARALEIDRLSP